MTTHWTPGTRRTQVTKRGHKLYWRTLCSRWVRLHQCAPWGPEVSCKQCLKRMAAVEEV